jgi:hypothetical protein
LLKRPILLLSLCSLSAVAGENQLTNGDFTLWKSYQGHGITTTSVGTPPNSLPDGWYGGPGVGATATYDVIQVKDGTPDVPKEIQRFLQVAWSKAPSEDWAGETHHQTTFRGTFLEYFGITDVRRLAGKTARFTFWARCENREVAIVPIIWHSYDAETPGIVAVKGKGYELFESSGVQGEVGVAQGPPRKAAVCHLTKKWQQFEKRITLPSVEGKSITAGHYTGVGFDFVERCAPVIDIANIRVEIVDEKGSSTPGAAGETK